MDKHGARTLLAVATAVVVAGCGGGSDNSSSNGGAGGESKGETIKVGAALIGPKNDKSFDQAAYEGIQAAQQQFPNLKLTAALENRATDAQRADAVKTLGPVNDLVVTVSSSFGPVLDVQAPRFRNAYFIDISGFTKQYHENVTGFGNDWGAMLYVAGVIAAHMTKSNVVGYVGGAEIPPTVQGRIGFTAGAKSVNPKINVLTNLIGDFNDVAKAKNATAAMITDGADVIFPFINGGLPGAYAAANESGKNPALFNEVIPNCDGYKNMVGTNFVDSKAITQRLLSDYIKKKLEPGAIFLGLQEPKLQTLQLCPKYQKNAEIARVTKETIDAINGGKIKLPAGAVNPRPSYRYREGFDGPVRNG